jgi:hypothetical protein
VHPLLRFTGVLRALTQSQWQYASDMIKFIIIAIAILHVLEEYFGGFVNYINQIVPGVTIFHFVFINILFLGFVVFAVFSSSNFLKLTVPLLLLINAAIHIGGFILFRKYNPGFVTACFCYVPISIYFIKKLKPQRELSFKSARLAALLMALPFLFQAIRLLLK